MNVIEQRDELIEMLTDSVGSLVSIVTIDAQNVQPLPGKAAVFIDPPDIEYEGWELSTVTWSVCVVAGTTATQAAAMDVIIKVLEKLRKDHINMDKAEPVTWNYGNSGDLPAYKITLNPFD
ncbi:hypothetical protein OZX62_01570 [Bifidobacterium sp. ESL0690]|uniref:hypothetical protein n=1 Tax=Bifidobacterium sp. ESL0690 TaxID=2983214 RepID=UPI0023FA380D|nr:hypothetical protein [Bifidobacterium sp. ESL0690]WEV47014.1 hypothetical protein OZX62_01570 [Bifidobacterium sp. ESL0690]